jgi:hypothetical protein
MARQTEVASLRKEVTELKAALARANAPQLSESLAKLESTVSDLTEERDSLHEDISGWRTRCADLERAVALHRMKLEEERRENSVAREKVRKLGDLLAESKGAGAAELAEMREQIFRMANELEKERGLRERAESQVAELESQREAAFHSSLSTSIFDHRDSISTKASTPPSLRSSFGKSSPMPFDLVTSGHGLQPLAEEEESGEAGMPELSHGRGSLGESDNDARSQRQSPTTPQLLAVAETQPEHSAGHERRNSFVKEWRMPKGPVEPQNVHIVNSDGDHSFFQLCPTKILPPLPLSESTLSLAASFDELVCDDAYHARHPSSPRPTPERISLSSFSSSAARHRSGRTSQDTAASMSSMGSYTSLQRSRVSLQNLGGLLGSYAAAVPSAFQTNAVEPASTERQQKQQPWLSKLSSSTSTSSSSRSNPRTRSRTISKEEQPRPRYSALSVLDFTNAVGIRSDQVLRI